MATTYLKMKLNPEFIKERHGHAATYLWLTRFARAYQDNKPVAPGIQITIGTDYFLLTDVEALALARDIIRAYTGEKLGEKLEAESMTCGECGSVRPNDERVQESMSCGPCSYNTFGIGYTEYERSV